MIKSAYGTPCLDPYATLSQQHKEAALVAGHAIPFLSDEAKYAATLSEQKSNTDLPAQRLG